MNLKEAFRYQNFLRLIMHQADGIISQPENVTKVACTTLRHKVDKEAEDELVLLAPSTEYHTRITDVIRFQLFLLEERTRLSAAIRKAKAGLELDLDSQTSLNEVRRHLAETLRQMNGLRSSEELIQGGGTGYRFNAEGNQVSYRCDLRRVTTINFDRNVVRQELERLYREADETSAAVDLCLVTTQVEYQPPLDVNADFDQAFEQYLIQRNPV